MSILTEAVESNMYLFWQIFNPFYEYALDNILMDIIGKLIAGVCLLLFLGFILWIRNRMSRLIGVIRYGH